MAAEAEAAYPRFKRCVLHIGTEKTGTTSLQSFLAVNHERLFDQGFVVPKSLSPYLKVANHERLTTFALQSAKISDDLRVAAGIQTGAKVEEHRAKIIGDLASELLSINDRSSTLLLSNEHLHSRLVDVSEVETLRQLVDRFAEETTVIVYLRPQHELAISLYDQALRGGYYDIDQLPKFENGNSRWVTRKYFDYDDLLKRWSTVYGAGAIKVRIYSKSDLIDGDVIPDYLEQIGCDGVGMVRSRHHNRNLGKDFHPVLNALNRAVSKGQLTISPKLRSKAIEAFRYLSLQPGTKPSREDAEEFLENFQSGNEAVRLLYRPDRKSLFNVSFEDYDPITLPGDSETLCLMQTVMKLVDTYVS